MARVDVDDDNIRRFVVRHFRFDPERHERRNVVVAAFDNEDEFIKLIHSIEADIKQRADAGAFVDKNEHASGMCLEPGHSRAAARGRFITKSLRHGVAPGPWLSEVEPPSNMWVMQFDDTATDTED